MAMRRRSAHASASAGDAVVARPGSRESAFSDARLRRGVSEPARGLSVPARLAPLSSSPDCSAGSAAGFAAAWLASGGGSAGAAGLAGVLCSAGRSWAAACAAGASCAAGAPARSGSAAPTCQREDMFTGLRTTRPPKPGIMHLSAYFKTDRSLPALRPCILHAAPSLRTRHPLTCVTLHLCLYKSTASCFHRGCSTCGRWQCQKCLHALHPHRLRLRAPHHSLQCITACAFSSWSKAT